MAITDNRTLVDDAEALDPAGAGIWKDDNDGVMSLALDTETFVEGAGSIGTASAKSTDGILWDYEADTDLTNVTLYIWYNSKVSGILATKANHGITMRFCGATVTDFFEVDIDGVDTYAGGWKMAVVNASVAAANPDNTGGTQPAVAVINYVGIVFTTTATTTGSGDNCFVDAIWTLAAGTPGIIVAGNNTDPWEWEDIIDAGDVGDPTKAWGTIQRINGIVFINTPIEFGTDDGTNADDQFEDINEIIAWEQHPIADHFYNLTAVGASGGSASQLFRLGQKTGTGVNATGSQGGVIVSAETPFRINAIDSDIDAGDYFGCNFIGSPFAPFDFLTFKVEDADVGFTDDTQDAASGATGDTDAMPSTQAIDDATYFGYPEKFMSILGVFSTAKGGTWTGTWEYFNGSSWVSLTDVGDSFRNYAAGTGIGEVDWQMPDDWAKNTVDGDNRYWIRFRISSFTSSGTVPVFDFIRPITAGDVRWERAEAESINCSYTNIGTIRVRNGAFLKRFTISNASIRGKIAALDLGSADPAVDTVRDGTIQNCQRGILLKGSGNTTYNFRNISFIDNNKLFVAKQEDASGPSFVEFTDEVNNPAVNDIEFFPVSPAVDDAFYIAERSTFNEVTVNVGTAGAGTYTIAVEYWNGTAWTAVSGLTDGTNAFKNAGINTITFTRPTDWVKVSVDTDFFYWLRFKRDAGTETTRPLGTQIQTPGDVRVDFPSGDTVTINILEGGTSPQVDNLNNSTIVIVDARTLKVTITNRAGSAQENFNIRFQQSDGTLIADGLTNSSGIFSFSIDGGQLPLTNARIIARKKAFEDFGQNLNIPAEGFDIPITAQPDIDVDLP